MLKSCTYYDLDYCVASPVNCLPNPHLIQQIVLPCKAKVLLLHPCIGVWAFIFCSNRLARLKQNEGVVSTPAGKVILEAHHYSTDTFRKERVVFESTSNCS